MLAASENNLISDDDPQLYLPTYIGHLSAEANAVLSSNMMPDADVYDYTDASLQSFMKARVKLVHDNIVRLCAGDF